MIFLLIVPARIALIDMLQVCAAEPFIRLVLSGLSVADFLDTPAHAAQQGDIILVPGMAVQDDVCLFLQEHHLVQFLQERGHRQASVQLHPQVMVDAVSGEQDPILPEQKQDSAGGMSRQMYYLKRPLPEIYQVSLARGLWRPFFPTDGIQAPHRDA